MRVINIDDIPDKKGRTAKRLLFICKECEYIGYVAVRGNLHSYVCQDCQSENWVALNGSFDEIYIPVR